MNARLKCSIVKIAILLPLLCILVKNIGKETLKSKAYIFADISAGAMKLSALAHIEELVVHDIKVINIIENALRKIKNYLFLALDKL